MPLSVLIHAPDAEALARARSNARNLLAARPDAMVEIVANAGAVHAALDTPDSATDPLLRLCANTLRAQGLAAPPDLATVPAAIVYLAEEQLNGRTYIRA